MSNVMKNHAETSTQRSRLGRLFAQAFLLGLPVLFLLSQFYIWQFWNPTLGDSFKYLATYAQIILSGFCLLLWWLIFAPFSFRTRALIGCIPIILIAGWVLSIRSFELSGDMIATFTYRWSPVHDGLHLH
ncbi:hypothetical protein SH668x_002000 [Planctomicrobium sp. SH668]|uniref:hypothetical protein n=1 Tax=Planctomicrobium sp. SH668 TaxID=3448126 RepID=UPI003F5AFA1F